MPQSGPTGGTAQPLVTQHVYRHRGRYGPGQQSQQATEVVNPEPTCALLFHCAIVLNTLVKSGSLGQGQNTVADQPHEVLFELPAGFRPMNHVQRTPRGYDERR